MSNLKLNWVKSCNSENESAIISRGDYDVVCTVRKSGEHNSWQWSCELRDRRLDCDWIRHNSGCDYTLSLSKECCEESLSRMLEDFWRTMRRDTEALKTLLDTVKGYE